MNAASVIDFPSYWDEACQHLMKKDRVMRKLIPQFGDARLVTRGDAFVTLARSIVGQAKYHDGRVLQGRVDEPKGDPGNTLSRDEITDKAMRLAAHSQGASPDEMRHALEQLWNITRIQRMGRLLP